MANYVTRASLEVSAPNGATTNIIDFKAVSEKARVLRKKVPLMYQSGTAAITQRYEVDADYVVPEVGGFNFDDITGGTLSIIYDNGNTITFGGVATAEIGDATVDGENEVVKKVRFICETRMTNTGSASAPNEFTNPVMG